MSRRQRNYSTTLSSEGIWDLPQSFKCLGTGIEQTKGQIKNSAAHSLWSWASRYKNHLQENGFCLWRERSNFPSSSAWRAESHMLQSPWHKGEVKREGNIINTKVNRSSISFTRTRRVGRNYGTASYLSVSFRVPIAQNQRQLTYNQKLSGLTIIHRLKETHSQ